MQDVFEKLIEKIRQNAYMVVQKNNSKELGMTLCGIEQAIQEISEQYNNGWIPCSERLPEDGETYLVTNAESFGQHHTYKGWYDVEHKIWHMVGNFERKMNVIAWQPLPQPYQPKGE